MRHYLVYSPTIWAVKKWPSLQATIDVKGNASVKKSLQCKLSSEFGDCSKLNKDVLKRKVLIKIEPYKSDRGLPGNHCQKRIIGNIFYLKIKQVNVYKFILLYSSWESKNTQENLQPYSLMRIV